MGNNPWFNMCCGNAARRLSEEDMQEFDKIKFHSRGVKGDVFTKTGDKWEDNWDGHP